ncbi:MAG: hypothetical protein HY791_05850 [Deltaproteobacteria bacterium]|nr:hypothetical protein [Deltaproteobacteria bacterium]
MSILVAMLAGSVVLQVQEASGLTPPDVARFVEELRSALDAQGQAARLDEGPRCEDEDECLRALAKRVGADETWSIRVFEAVTVIRVVVKRAGLEPARFDLATERSEWGAQLSKMVRAVLQTAAPTEDMTAALPEKLVPQPVRAPEGDSTASLLLVAGGSASVVTGAILAVLAHASYSELSDRLETRDIAGRIVGVSYSEAVDQRDSAATSNSVGLILVTVGVAAASVGAALLLEWD